MDFRNIKSYLLLEPDSFVSDWSKEYIINASEQNLALLLPLPESQKITRLRICPRRLLALLGTAIILSNRYAHPNSLQTKTKPAHGKTEYIRAAVSLVSMLTALQLTFTGFKDQLPKIHPKCRKLA